MDVVAFVTIIAFVVTVTQALYKRDPSSLELAPVAVFMAGALALAVGQLLS